MRKGNAFEGALNALTENARLSEDDAHGLLEEAMRKPGEQLRRGNGYVTYNGETGMFLVGKQ